jgi:hypothetical protein
MLRKNKKQIKDKEVEGRVERRSEVREQKEEGVSSRWVFGQEAFLCSS